MNRRGRINALLNLYLPKTQAAGEEENLSSTCLICRKLRDTTPSISGATFEKFLDELGRKMSFKEKR
jgi:hypothetical protein